MPLFLGNPPGNSSVANDFPYRWRVTSKHPMRIPPLLFGVSVAANLGLAFVWYSKSNDLSAAGPAAVSPHAGATTTPLAAAATTTATGDASGTLSPEVTRALPELFRQLVDGDLSAGVARLRAAGMSEDTVNLIAQAVVMKKFKKAYEELGGDGMNFLMWGGGYARTDAQREAQRKMQEIQKKLSEEARAAGVDRSSFFNFGRKVPGLSAEKSEQLARLEADRQEMRSQVHTEASGMMLDRDTERLKYIDAEFKKDLAALLTPEELEAWSMQRSETAQNLRAQLAYMAPTDEEFRKILKLQEAFNEAWPSNFGGNTDWQKRSEAERAMKKQIAEVLGPTRAADYDKATSYEFGTLSNLEYRLELPKGSADKVLGLHKETDEAARKIRSDKSLSDADRKESLKVLAEQVKSELVGVLGEEGMKAYRNQNSHWIDGLTR